MQVQVLLVSAFLKIAYDPAMICLALSVDGASCGSP